ncbi:hypothetical protein [Ktedonospora formicarum]|uniref:hypothetical protein n=1 Tax=Ktedonospora formicarum TaxID=2778364 RepID=UPI001C6907F1|nr:hypothetical protein [Ktedonospora formicarum]
MALSLPGVDGRVSGLGQAREGPPALLADAAQQVPVGAFLVGKDLCGHLEASHYDCIPSDRAVMDVVRVVLRREDKMYPELILEMLR